METVHYAIAPSESGVQWSVWYPSDNATCHIRAVSGKGSQTYVHPASSASQALEVIRSLGALRLVDKSACAGVSGADRLSADHADSRTSCAQLVWPGLSGAVCMDKDKIVEFLNCQASAGAGKQMVALRGENKGSCPNTITLTFGNNSTNTVLYIKEAIAAGSSGLVVRYSDTESTDMDNLPVHYALKVHCKGANIELEKYENACILIRDMYLVALHNGTYFPFLPTIFVPEYGNLSYCAEATSSDCDRDTRGSDEVEVIRAMVVALQLLEQQGKILPDGKAGNVVTMTVGDEIKAYVVDWDSIVDGWSKDEDITIFSTYTPPGVEAIRQMMISPEVLARVCLEDKIPLVEENDCYYDDGEFFLKGDGFGHMSSYIMIGSVFVTACELCPGGDVYAPDSNVFYNQHLTSANDTARCALQDFIISYNLPPERQPIAYLTQQLAIMLLAFQKSILECISTRKESRTLYQDTLKKILEKIEILDNIPRKRQGDSDSGWLSGAMCMDKNKIIEFINCQASAGAGKQMVQFLCEKTGLRPLTITLTFENYEPPMELHLKQGIATGFVVRYSPAPSDCTDMEEKTVQYALKVCLNGADIELEKYKNACIFIRDMHLAALSNGTYFPFLPTIFVPDYGNLSYCGEATSDNRELYTEGSYKVEVIRAMVVALQLLEQKGKILPDCKAGNVVTMTVGDEIKAYVVDWDSIVDGWSKDEDITIFSTNTPPGVEAIRTALNDHGDADRTFLVKGDGFGHMSSYIMIGCVFVTAFELCKVSKVDPWKYNEYRTSENDFMRQALLLRSSKLKCTPGDKRPIRLLTQQLAIMLLAFQKSILECIRTQTESRPLYRETLKKILDTIQTLENEAARTNQSATPILKRKFNE